MYNTVIFYVDKSCNKKAKCYAIKKGWGDSVFGIEG